jgi:catechol 2,3-dioxygenase-like lactoylglutathione lyase family enzyme
MSINIGHLAVNVKDMNKSLDFYTRVLGFERVLDINKPETGEPWIVYVHMGGGQFIELFYGGKADAGNTEPSAFNHICLVSDDIQEFSGKILRSNYPIDREPRLGPDNNWQMWVVDPDGIRIEIMQISKQSPHGRILASL